MSVDPERPVTLRGESVPTGAQLRISVAGLGNLVGVTRDVSGGTTTVRIADYVPLKGGLYALEGTLLVGGIERCVVGFWASLGEFGVPVATRAAAASGVAGLGALASVPYSASGMNVKLKANVALNRRRPRGLRRWLPVPAWKRTLVGMVVGALTGLCVSVLLQQGDHTPVTRQRRAERDPGRWSDVRGRVLHRCHHHLREAAQRGVITESQVAVALRRLYNPSIHGQARERPAPKRSSTNRTAARPSVGVPGDPGLPPALGRRAAVHLRPADAAVRQRLSGVRAFRLRAPVRPDGRLPGSAAVPHRPVRRDCRRRR